MEQLRVMIVSVLMVLISALSSAAQQSGTAANTGAAADSVRERRYG